MAVRGCSRCHRPSSGGPQSCPWLEAEDGCCCQLCPAPAFPTFLRNVTASPSALRSHTQAISSALRYGYDRERNERDRSLQVTTLHLNTNDDVGHKATRTDLSAAPTPHTQRAPLPPADIEASLAENFFPRQNLFARSETSL